MFDEQLKEKIEYQKTRIENLGNCLKIILARTKELGDYFSCTITKESVKLYNDIFDLVRLNESLQKMKYSNAQTNAYYEKISLLSRKLEMGICSVSKKISTVKIKYECEKI